MGAQAVRLSNVDINNALENKDFEVLFQPIFDLGNGALARMETFVRWRHPTLGVLPPGAFISFFETQGRMSELTRYVLEVALDGYLEWRGAFAPGFSINLALTDLTDEAFAPHFTKLLRDREFPADLVTLECPMPAIDTDMDALSESFARLRKTGARLAIEVRGRANDFLRSVDPFPFDEIKTGGSSILRFARTVRGPGLSAISDLLDIAQKANAVTTAVGVEDQASLSALRGLGFTAAQGNHLAKVGGLSNFRPGQVNDVRKLLDLPPLSGDDLSSLFRTTAPEPKAAAPQARPSEKQADENPTADENGKDKTSSELSAEDIAAQKQEILVRARKKARAIALAKRAKARDARKAAAIKRAKTKASEAEKLPEEDLSTDTEAFPPVAEPRALQDRIVQEFSAEAEDEENPEDIDAYFDEGLDDDDSDEIEAEASVDFEEPDIEDETIVDAPQQSPQPSVEPVADEVPLAAQDMQLKLPIGQSPVHFRPGILVRGLPTTIHDQEIAEPEDELTDSIAEEDMAALADIGGGSDELFEDGAKTIARENPQTDVENQEEQVAAETASAVPQGSLFQETSGQPESSEQSTVSTPVKRARKKNFLARRYRVVPTHFWPKSWTRALRERRAAAAAQTD